MISGFATKVDWWNHKKSKLNHIAHLTLEYCSVLIEWIKWETIVNLLHLDISNMRISFLTMFTLLSSLTKNIQHLSIRNVHLHSYDQTQASFRIATLAVSTRCLSQSNGGPRLEPIGAKQLVTNLKTISFFLEVTPDFPSFDICDSKIISRIWMAQFFNTAAKKAQNLRKFILSITVQVRRLWWMWFIQLDRCHFGLHYEIYR